MESISERVIPGTDGAPLLAPGPATQSGAAGGARVAIHQRGTRRRRVTFRRTMALASFFLITTLGMPASLAQPASATAGRSRHDNDEPQLLAWHACTDAQPCQLSGTYVLGPGTVAPGLQFTVPAGGWTANHVNAVEVNLIPPGERAQHGDRVGFWVDPVAVQPDGPNFGEIRADVGTKARDLIDWFTHEPAFATSRPRPVVIGHTFPAKSLDVQASTSARPGDPGCPADHCVNVFSNAQAGPGGIGIGGDETIRLNIGMIHIDHQHHTFIIGLDGFNPTDLDMLQTAAQPILDSVRVPRPCHRG